MQGKQALVKGWAWGTGMNLTEFTEMPARGCWVSQHFLNASNSSTFVGQDSEPQTAPAVNTARTWEMLWGAAGTWPHPYHSLRLQRFRTVPSAQEVPSPIRPTEVLQQQHCRESEEQLLRKWPLIADKESMGFVKWMAPNHAFYLDF